VAIGLSASGIVLAVVGAILLHRFRDGLTLGPLEAGSMSRPVGLGLSLVTGGAVLQLFAVAVAVALR
jgi:hypothetical protein